MQHSPFVSGTDCFLMTVQKVTCIFLWMVNIDLWRYEMSWNSNCKSCDPECDFKTKTVRVDFFLLFFSFLGVVLAAEEPTSVSLQD